LQGDAPGACEAHNFIAVDSISTPATNFMKLRTIALLICLLLHKEKLDLIREVHRKPKSEDHRKKFCGTGVGVLYKPRDFFPHNVWLPRKKLRDYYENPDWSWDGNACGTRMSHIAERMPADSYFDAAPADRLKFAFDNGLFKHT
jgi:hypothetical protein